MPVKHIASFNKNGFGKHSDLINVLFHYKTDQVVLGKKV